VRSFGIATSTGEAPFFVNDTPGLREYHRVLARWAGAITPDLVLRGLGAIRNESLGGLTVGVTFHPGQQSAGSSGCVFSEFLTTTGWTAPNGSRPVCR
jgi:branched-chain amino acid transport system substrate-binding protein